ncbi:Gfo/Idh/MocA family protein [Egicoccus halophilus]|uniref:Dehydrogenase n=1 Tax=Egicoccus halophilus TaxID=1670830 RepID=A0A8J3A4P0_9ACTN|nr:Gfo/Idh/MocA family oxidoreductase [Egicoccus halophilus]GGI02362.1 dehydrogenase [Egicoccus halophilus]
MGDALRVAIVGYGLAVAPVERAFLAHGGFDIRACVDPSQLARHQFEEKFGSGAYDSMDRMLDDVEPDVVYVATPTRTHHDLSVQALATGASVLVEKPIALDLDEAVHMIAEARRHDGVLMVNHKRSADREVLAMRAAIRRGDIGTPRWTSRLHFSDWMYRWRAAEERDPAVGGVVLRQGAHEFDILRGLLPSAPVRLRGWVGDLADELPGEGAYSAWIECSDGSMATSVYSGYDRFRSDELTAGLLPPGLIGATHRTYRQHMQAGADEYRLKQTVGHPRAPELLEDLYGFSFAMCGAGDVRTAPNGSAWVYGRSGRRRVTVDGPAGTDLIVAELHEAIRHGTAPAHDGSWGLACLELCVAVRESAMVGEAVQLQHQAFTADGFLTDDAPLRSLEH